MPDTLDERKIEYRKRDYLSVSTLTNFARCPRRYFYQKCGLTSPGEFAAPVYGQAMHKACPVILLGGSVNDAMEAFMSVWDDALTDDKHNLDRAAQSLAHYHFTHQGDRALFKLVDPPQGDIPIDRETSDMEVPFAIDIGLPIPLCGRIDGLARHRDTGELWGWELKTASRMTSNFFDQFEMNVQVLAYTLVLHTMTGENIRGVMVEGMLKDKRKVDNLCHPVPVPAHHLQSIADWLKFYGGLLLKCEEIGEFPQDFTGCSAYTHFYIPTYRCEYADLCRMPDWRMATDLYAVQPEHQFMQITTKQTDA